MFITTEPQLFKEMLRIRVGLITEVIASEMGRLLEGSKSLFLEHKYIFTTYKLRHAPFYILYFLVKTLSALIYFYNL
jgi:phosphorylase kinase alpha/beta subunit